MITVSHRSRSFPLKHTDVEHIYVIWILFRHYSLIVIGNTVQQNTDLLLFVRRKKMILDPEKKVVK